MKTEKSTAETDPKEAENQELTEETAQTAKSKKTDKEFIEDLTTKEPLQVTPTGTFTSTGAFPQVLRKAVQDKVNGMVRTSY